MTTIRVKGKKAPIAQKITLDTGMTTTPHWSRLLFSNSTKPVPPRGDHPPLQLNTSIGCIVLCIYIPLRLNILNRYSELGKKKGDRYFQYQSPPSYNNNQPTI